MHFVYIVRCSDDTLYTGYTTDVARRLREHNGEEKGGAKYTAGRGPVELVYKEAFKDRSGAMKREAELKKLSKEEKNSLIKGALR